jgi:hypothetical protein
VAFVCLALPCGAQITDQGSADGTGNPPNSPYPVAQPAPAAAQDAEATREKLLKASDQLDMIQSNYESTKIEVDSMKSDIAQLQAANSALKDQLTQLQADLNKAEAERAKERQVLVDEVATLVASRSEGSSRPKKHSAPETSPDDSSASTEVHTPDTESAAGETSPDSASGNAGLAPPPENPTPKPSKGYYHVVESGETLTEICSAYRDQGVKVSISQVRKANGLTEKSVLKVGQKLFIPKPGT